MLSINLTSSNHTATQMVVPACVTGKGTRVTVSTTSTYSTFAADNEFILLLKWSFRAIDEDSEARAI